MIDVATLERLLPDFMVRQRWYGFGDVRPERVEVTDFEVWRDSWPGLVWALARPVFADEGAESDARFQVLVGLRSIDEYMHFLDGKGRSLLGDVATGSGEALAYDALVDGELALEIVRRIAPDFPANAVRPLPVDQTNTSIVVDDSAILKVFRRIRAGANPDAELPRRLWDVGFHQTPEPIAEWRRGDDDLAVLRRFLPSGTDGFVLALTSLRDLYSSRLAPEQCGGDFAPEARRLGEVTASLHTSLAQAFGIAPGDATAWTEGLADEVTRVEVPGISPDELVVRVRQLVGHAGADVGAAVRIHGDFHLGQTMRTDSGWFLLDFEGEPSRPLAERVLPASPLRDVAGMMRSFHYAADVALAERGDDVDTELRSLAAAWEARARTAFLDGYRAAVAGPESLVPTEPTAFASLLRAFELAKAVYEVGYELAHRPEWVDIPREAVQRLLSPPL